MAYETLTYSPGQLRESGGFEVAETAYEDGSVQTRLINQNPELKYRFAAQNRTQAQAQAYRTFWLARHGAYEPFYMINDITGDTMQVRFVQGSWRCTIDPDGCDVGFEIKVDYS